jgi:hypothetical protein
MPRVRVSITTATLANAGAGTAAGRATVMISGPVSLMTSRNSEFSVVPIMSRRPLHTAKLYHTIKYVHVKEARGIGLTLKRNNRQSD